MILMLPLFYFIVGTLYGTIAIVNRVRLAITYRKLSPEQKHWVRENSDWQGFTSNDFLSFLVTLLLLLSGLLVLVGTAVEGPFVSLGILGLCLFPFFVIGFNVQSVWHKPTVFRHHYAMSHGNVAMIVYYCALLLLWTVGVIASYIGTGLIFVSLFNAGAAF